MGVKRWIVVAFAGLLLLALGAAHAIRQATQDLEPGGIAGTVIDVLTLRFLPYEARGVLVAVAGTGLFLYGAIRLVRTLVDPFTPWDRDQPLVEVIYQKRFLARGPRIVAIGGGTGLSSLLRGLKEHTSNLTAVVTVADDGGSSGVLRTELGIPAVGDIRNCIVALADAEPLMARLLQYRFPGSPAMASPDREAAILSRDAEVGPAGLAGHPVGNLLLAAMTAIQDGDFEEAVREVNRVLAVRGRVVPATPTALTLHARLTDGSQVDGQSRIMRTPNVESVWVTPDDVVASQDAVRAIAEADIIVLGPGSLFTSLLPVLLVPGIREAIAASPAMVVFACNVATQAGETGGFDLADHFDALDRHGAGHLPDVVLANNRFDARPPEDWAAEPVRLRWPPARPNPPRLGLDDVVDDTNAHHHDPARLGAAVLRIWEREGGHRRRATAPRVSRGTRTA